MKENYLTEAYAEIVKRIVSWLRRLKFPSKILYLLSISLILDSKIWLS